MRNGEDRLLEYTTKGSSAEGATVLVMLHGRGADASDMLGLANALPPGHVIVAPRAPFEAAPWGYGPGRAWYRYLGEDRPEPESFEESQTRLGEWLDALPSLLAFTPGAIVLGGFSQGGTMSLAHALRRPGVVPAVLNFSGFLASHASVRADAETVRGTRIFWGHGTQDPNIPYTLAERGRAVLRAAGADLTEWNGRMGHWIDPDELAAALEWIAAAPAGREAATS
jgi:phospholipase/carboxylesterase